MTEAQKRLADRFLEMHLSPGIFILANAWDVSSAKVFEAAGFEAIGTTSAGISASLGYRDGQGMELDDNIEVVRRIAHHVDLPVSADIERGYSGSTEGIVEAAGAVLDAGAVGLNLEDGTGDDANPLFDVNIMAERISAVREMAESEGIHLVINLRTDVYLVPPDDPELRFRTVIERAGIYREAGADSIFVPDMGAFDAGTIGRLTAGIDAPLNIIAGAHTPPIGELETLGVSRVSLGPRPMRALLARLKEMSRELLAGGTYGMMTDNALSYAEVNGWFTGGRD